MIPLPATGPTVPYALGWQPGTDGTAAYPESDVKRTKRICFYFIFLCCQQSMMTVCTQYQAPVTMK